MHLNLTSAASLSLLALASALPSLDYVAHETRDTSNWVKGERVEADAVLPVRVGLTQTNLANLYSALDEVSNPKSSKYGKHWTKQEVNRKFAPTRETIDSALGWVISSGIPRNRILQTENRGWLAFHATASELEKLMDTQFHYFELDGRQTVAADNYKVPKHVQRHIDYIVPGIKISPQTRPRVSRPRTLRKPQVKSIVSNSTVCDWTNVTPACYKQLYQLPSGTSADPSNSLGIYAADGGPSQFDLDAFFAAYAPNVPNGTYPTVKGVDGGDANTDDFYITEEADLDFEIAIPLIYPQTTTLWTVDITADDLFNPLLDAFDGSYCNFTAFGQNNTSPGNPQNATCGGFTSTNVLSISYVTAETELPASFQERQCLEFAKLGLQGVSILVASGDAGVSARGPGPDGEFCIGPENNTFVPAWPANCPAVTAVGATRLLPNNTEAAANGTPSDLLYRSGGGFSNIYSAPLYQLSAIDQYLSGPSAPPYPFYNLTDPIGLNGGRYNRQGRAFPDVSAVGANNAFAGVYNGSTAVPQWGTSASAPLFAAVVNLINEERLAAGKGPVGFLNPVLYANPDAFTDVTVGDTEGCGTQGFLAGSGWDPVTGLGTPVYPRLVEAFMSLP